MLQPGQQTVPAAWLLVWLAELPDVVEVGCRSVQAQEEGDWEWALHPQLGCALAVESRGAEMGNEE